MNTYYTGKMKISIKAYYDTGHTSIYYREMYLSEIVTWIDAHTYTHPGVLKYSIMFDTYYNR